MERTPPAVVLADRYAGVRTALREQLESAGAARVVAEAQTLAEARAAGAAHPGALIVAGLTFPDGPVSDLLASGRTGAGPAVVVYTWLPADEHGLDLRAAAAVVGPPLVRGLLVALRSRRGLRAQGGSA